ncbi:hypothetical protein [Candidatus Methylomirabilis sp.]|uniref:hypothetical protein n=1 Tax=Candidatus Methylomirabilis sp. TaxID=2032687 RepID=UPI00307674E6
MRDKPAAWTRLTSFIEQYSARPVTPGIRTLADALLKQYGNGAAAILAYGSCFRNRTDEGLVDLCVLVDSYRSLPGSSWQQWLYRLLPPTVFYLETPHDGRLLRAKYIVISCEDFERGVSPRCFYSYLWGRFAQPTGVLYVRDESSARRVYASLAQAVVTFVDRVVPVLPSTFDARDLWQQGLRLSYGTELRPERTDAVARLVDHSLDYYEQVTRIGMDCVPFDVRPTEEGRKTGYRAAIPFSVRFMSGLAWRLRKVHGKMLNVLRLLKGLLTFKSGRDYILWKIERHSGMRIDVPSYYERYPWFATALILGKLYRQGAFR